MLRIIVRMQDLNPTYVGGKPIHKIKSFDVDAPEIEKMLRESNPAQMFDNQVIGVEVVDG